MDIWTRRPEMIDITADFFGIAKNQLLSKSRVRGVLKAREMFSLWVLDELKLTQEDAAKFLTGVIGNRSTLSSMKRRIKGYAPAFNDEYKTYKKQMDMRAMGSQVKNITFESEEKVSYISGFIDGQNQYREAKICAFVANDNGSMVVELRTHDGFKVTVQRTMIRRGWND